MRLRVADFRLPIDPPDDDTPALWRCLNAQGPDDEIELPPNLRLSECVGFAISLTPAR